MHIVEIEPATEIEQLNSDYSDFYKEVHGIRPRWVWFTSVEESVEDFQRLREESENAYLQDLADIEQEAYALRMGLSEQFKANKYEWLAGEA